MTNVDGIGGTAWLQATLQRATARSAAGTAGSPSPAPGTRNATGFSPVITTTFARSISDVLRDAQRGAYDDPDVTDRIAQLRSHLTSAAVPVTGSGPITDAATGGAHAAPGQPEAADVTAVAVPAAEARQLAVLEVEQARGRAARVHGSLNQRFARGSSLPSALTGQLDVASFRPRTKAEAQAFAERLAIDVTEGTAQLEVVASQLQVARIDAATNPGSQTQVAQLEAEFARRQTQLGAIADEVDRRSGNSIQDIEVGGAPYGESAALLEEAAKAGMSGDEVLELRKLEVMAREEAATGNSATVNKVQQKTTDVIMRWFAREEARRAQRHEEEQRRKDEEYDRERADSKAREWQAGADRAVAEFVQQAAAQREAADQYAAQQSAQRNAQHLAAIQSSYGAAS